MRRANGTTAPAPIVTAATAVVLGPTLGRTLNLAQARGRVARLRRANGAVALAPGATAATAAARALMLGLTRRISAVARGRVARLRRANGAAAPALEATAAIAAARALMLGLTRRTSAPARGQPRTLGSTTRTRWASGRPRERQSKQSSSIPLNGQAQVGRLLLSTRTVFNTVQVFGTRLRSPPVRPLQTMPPRHRAGGLEATSRHACAPRQQEAHACSFLCVCVCFGHFGGIPGCRRAAGAASMRNAGKVQAQQPFGSHGLPEQGPRRRGGHRHLVSHAHCT